MLILSLDTTTRTGSVAIVRDGTILHEQSGDAALTHAQRLPRDLIGACDAAGVRIADVELFAVAAGPGSFTGLRIGIATIQGLAMAWDRRVVPVSTLEALAAAAPGGAERVAAWMDAQRGEVFAQLFEREPGGQRPLGDPVAAAPQAVLAPQALRLEGAEFHGDGALRYRDEIIAVLGPAARIANRVAPLAGAIGLIADRHQDQAVLPHALVPIYLRRPDAEIVRDRPAAVTDHRQPLLIDRLRQPVAADDRAAVIALETGSFANPWTAETFDKMLATTVSHVYVARLPDARIVGFCACWVIDDEVHINTVAVHDAFRRQGIASALLEGMLTRTGARRATLEVRRSNAAAIGLYEKLGFRITAVRPGYYGNPDEDGLILWLNP